MPPHLSRPSYAAVLRVPHARRTFAAALTARLPYGTVALAVMLSVTRATGSYAVSGAVMSTTVFLMPLRASLVDRHGPRRALPPMAAFYGILLGVLAALTWRPGAPSTAHRRGRGPRGRLRAPLGPTMRALWARLVADRGLLRRAYSLDAIAEELLYVRLCWFAVALGAVIAAAGRAPGLWTLTAAMACAGAGRPPPRRHDPEDTPWVRPAADRAGSGPRCPVGR
ncbi:hypothetical protein [Streptomyces sp. NPDC007905]|uniref:hypothetical protein n=1 Tax=Streptomyces sp. NPDC007905 TaxID=3364788 RepID=UPI0036E7AC00